jgi:HPt (histidine-containing phosphotransfer) domain-containing protein
VTEPILDPAAFAHLLEITGDDLEFVDELVDTFLDDGGTQLAAMRAAAASGDIEALVRPVHSLKSSSANVGAAALADACRVLEADARSGSVPDAGARVTACEGAFEAARDALLAERAAR